MPTVDGDPTAWVIAESSTAPKTGVWTHLLASYDPLTKTATLYVNGVKQNSASGALGAWNAAGGLQIGRAKYAGGYTDEWPGAIDDVRLYDRTISDQPTVVDAGTGTGDPASRELWQMVNRPYQLQGHYPMQTPEFLPLPGTEVPDSSDNAAPGTLHGDPAAVWAGSNDGNFTPGGHFNGTTDYIDTQAPALRTDQPFTVAARDTS
ncbi:MAG: LamG domain-containing protein, partial [Stackebrandtia sp.]